VSLDWQHGQVTSIGGEDFFAIPVFYARNGSHEHVSWLCLKNAEGRHIYLRPADEHSLSLIDDASVQVIERLKSEGFAPAVVLKTSLGNFQAWLRYGQILPIHRLGGLAALWKTCGIYEPQRKILKDRRNLSLCQAA
jgi:hypothetical protein